MFSKSEFSESSSVSDSTASRSKNPNFNSDSFSWMVQKKNPFAYLILNKNGMVIVANELDNPEKLLDFLPKESDPSNKGLPYVYIVFRGEMITGDTTIPIQLVFMKRRFIGNADSMHFRVYELAIDIFKIEDICSLYNIKLNKDFKDGKLYYYFSGEFVIIGEVKSLESLQHKQLEKFMFDTRGTKTNEFRAENSPALVSHIPESCMKFDLKYDKLIKDKIIMPSSQTPVVQSNRNEPFKSDPRDQTVSAPLALESSGDLETLQRLFSDISTHDPTPAQDPGVLGDNYDYIQSTDALEGKHKEKKSEQIEQLPKKIALTLISQSKLFSDPQSSENKKDAALEEAQAYGFEQGQ
ncbi:hypothetical protein ACQUW5_00450 [Legionella sp. CNM-1927-20]|uniref:hypothetical protein n=1 Tax=Legionella sp. CNM-1927-20 TaxID=3422221 RepID=UPI00403AE70B